MTHTKKGLRIMNVADEWVEKAKKIIDWIRETQMQRMEKAADAISDSIISGHVCYLFGVGHSKMPVEEMFPRYGGLVGFLPIIELPLSFFTHITGDMGIPQFQFLERMEGYGSKILENYVLDDQDTMIVFSQSGVNPVIMDVALGAREKGVTLIAVTSLAHSKALKSGHSSRKRLFEVADIVIDTGVPYGDVMIEIEGLDQKVGPGSTIGFVVVANLVSCLVAGKIVEKGGKPMVNPVSSVTPNADEILRENVREFRRRLASHLP